MRISDWSSDVCSSDLLQLTTFNRDPRHAVSRHLFHQFGKQRDDIDFHHQSGCQSQTMRPASISISRTICGLTIGIKRSVSPACITSRSEEHTSELQSLMRISYAVFCLTKNTSKSY